MEDFGWMNPLLVGYQDQVRRYESVFPSLCVKLQIEHRQIAMEVV
jgi:hypothetical protein